MKTIAIHRSDGGVSILRTRSENVTRVVEKWAASFAEESNQSPPWEEAAEDQIPTDRVFRDAWVPSAASVRVDLPLARIIHAARIDRVAAETLAATDAEVTEQLETGAPVQPALRARRQALRALSAFDLRGATTPEELEALWPAEIERRLAARQPRG